MEQTLLSHPVIGSNIDLKYLFGEYLEHSCRYYVFDKPVVSDAYFDAVCQVLLANWGNFEHLYKCLCDESALSAGTGFQMANTIPNHIVLLCKRYPDVPLKEVFQSH